MAVPKRKTSKSKKNMRRSHHSLVNINLIEETFKLYDRNPIFIHHIKAHTGNNDEHSIGNSIADKLATDALKFEKKNEGILKYFQ